MGRSVNSALPSFHDLDDGLGTLLISGPAEQVPNHRWFQHLADVPPLQLPRFNSLALNQVHSVRADNGITDGPIIQSKGSA